MSWPEELPIDAVEGELREMVLRHGLVVWRVDGDRVWLGEKPRNGFALAGSVHRYALDEPAVARLARML